MNNDMEISEDWFPNYETWNVALWIDNDYRERAEEAAREVLSWCGPDGIAEALRGEGGTSQDLAYKLKDMFGPESATWDEEPLSGPAADMLSEAWSRVCWWSIADRIMLEALKAHGTPEP